MDSSKQKSVLIKQQSLFTYGGINEPFFIKVSTIQFNHEQKLELESSLDQALTLLENSGAMNIIVKRNDFETEKGIIGIKAYGEFNVLSSENKMLKKKSSYELLLFLQQNGLQEVLVVYQDDGRFSKAIKNRIINSIEIEISKENKNE